MKGRVGADQSSPSRTARLVTAPGSTLRGKPPHTGDGGGWYVAVVPGKPAEKTRTGARPSDRKAKTQKSCAALHRNGRAGGVGMGWARSI